MSTGMIALVAFGNQNRIFNGNPEVTKFYKSFQRYTHFSQESITIPVDGPNQLTLSSPIRLRAKITRNADLMTDLTFVFQIPSIYSKLYDPDESGVYQTRPSFRWIHMLGALIIDTVAIYVGGSKVQEFTGEWIAMRAAADMPAEKYMKWRQMIGDTAELNEPEWGVYGHSPNYPYAKGEYPHVVPATGGSAPSIVGREIRVPLPFWFSDSWGKALPLISLQLHEVEVQITLRPLQEIYRVMDPTFQTDPVRIGTLLTNNPAYPTSYDPTNPGANDNLTLQNEYSTTEVDPRLFPNNFYTDYTAPVPTSYGFDLNPRLEGNYIYLTEKEQQMFASRELQQLVHQVQNFNLLGISRRSLMELDAHSLIHRVLFFARRNDAIVSRNDYLNLSNWKNLTQSPYIPIAGQPVPNSGVYSAYAQRDILNTARFLCAGNQLFEEKPAAYFELQNAYTNTTGAAALGPDGIKPNNVLGPYYHLPFCLDGSDHSQPSGSLNASRIREIQLDVNPYAIDPNMPYAYDFTVYVESMNLVKFMNGMAGLAFAV
jgi:hypothetical protein